MADLRDHFRTARKAGPGWNLFKTLCQIICFWSFFLVALPALIQWLETQIGLPGFAFAGQRVIGGVAFCLLSSLGLYSAWHMAVRGEGTPLPLDTARQLVVSGPYRYVRNPMAMAGVGQGLAVGVWLGSWGVLVYASLGIVLWNQLARPAEEAEMARRLGPPYQHYRDHVPCWRPRLTPYRPDPGNTTE